MRMLRFAAVALALLLATPAVAQWQTPNHSVPIGRGGGTIGFGSAVPGTLGVPLVSTGLTLDPIFAPVQNVGILPGAANTLKGTLDGVNTSDLTAPNCTPLGSAWRYTNGVGINCGTVIALTGFDMPINLGLSAAAASSSLTLTLTQANGSAPTSSNPVVTPFRSTTPTSGTVALGTNSSPVSITIPNGANLGTTNSIPFRAYVFLEYNGGIPALAVATCSTPTAIAPCAAWESTLKTTTTISSSSNSAGVLYAGVGVSSDAVRIVGYCDFASGLNPAGAWTSSCTTIQIMGPGIKKPGEVLQTQAPNFGTLAVVTFTGTPTATNATVSLTPNATMNLVRYSGAISSSNGTTGSGCSMQFYRGTAGATAIGTLLRWLDAAGSGGIPHSTTFSGLDFPNSVAANTYVIKGNAGPSGGTCSAPAVNTDSATVVVEEIQG